GRIRAHHRPGTCAHRAMALQALQGERLRLQRPLHRPVLHLRQRFRERRQARRKLPGLWPPARNAHRRKFLLQALRFPKAAARFLSQESRFHSAGKPQERNRDVCRGRPEGSQHHPTTIRWGIPVPGEEPHVFYVWFDALTAYLSAVGGPDYEKRGMWPADVHFVGKDIIRFHAVYWPAFLMAAMLPLPKQVWAHGWFLMDAAKMSKSKGNVVLPRPIANMLGMDALRYFMLREVVFGQDGNFSYDSLVTRYNSDLANGLGNLASRTVALIEKNFAGKVPKPAELQPQDDALAKEAQSAIGEVLERLDKMEFARALEAIWAVIAAADKYLTTEQPWALGASEAGQARKATILWTTAELLRIVSALAHPILPDSTAKVWALLGQATAVGSVELDGLRWGQLVPGTALGKPQTLFPRVDKTEAIERIEAMANEELNSASAAPKPASAPATPAGAAATAPAVPEKIGIEDFAKVEMRVGQIKTAERIVGADKLLKLTVDIGTEIRQICAGIAQYYEPESLIGRKVAVVVNLAPRKLRGVESNGMIIAASVGPEGRPVLAGFLEEVEVGARLK